VDGATERTANSNDDRLQNLLNPDEPRYRNRRADESTAKWKTIGASH